VIRPGQKWRYRDREFTVSERVSVGRWLDDSGGYWYASEGDSFFPSCELIAQSEGMKPANIGSELDTEHLAKTGEIRVTDPKTGGAKGKKPSELGAIDPLALTELGNVAGYGSSKYERFNFLRGYAWSLSVDALYRHFLAFQAGEDRDPETGYPHMAHVAWHALCLTSFLLRGIGTDDRAPRP
jgi:hypothetical protein